MGCVVLGVTGGIAAYRAADIARRLVKLGHEVYAILTRNATEFVTVQTMETMTRHPVAVDMFVRPEKWEVEHIALAKRADVFLVAPATANFLGKMAAGVADDMLTTTVMATKAPVLIAPAMNTNMYENPVTQRNIRTLTELGARFVEPAYGMLANGDMGKGHIAETEDILAATLQLLQGKKDLAGKRVLVTAGPTREPIDPVRYITNRSSGKMGYALAQAAAERGAEVTLLTGPVSLPAPSGVTVTRIETTAQLYEAALRLAPEQDAILQAAAPSDYRPKYVAQQKIKRREGENLSVELEPNPDIAAALGANKRPGQVLVAFAAETQHVAENAKGKLERKNADFIVANDVTQPGAGFDVETNIALLIDRQGVTELPLMKKSELAQRILDKVAKALGR